MVQDWGHHKADKSAHGPPPSQCCPPSRGKRLWRCASSVHVSTASAIIETGLMSDWRVTLNLGFFNKVRRNHALEHATITLAHSGMGESGILGGNSMQWGFLGVWRRAHGRSVQRRRGCSAAPEVRRVRSGRVAVLRHEPRGGRDAGRRGMCHSGREEAAVEQHPAVDVGLADGPTRGEVRRPSGAEIRDHERRGGRADHTRRRSHRRRRVDGSPGAH